MKTLLVDPNQSHEIAVELDCAVNASVSWDFETVDGSPMSFEVTLVHENNHTPTEHLGSNVNCGHQEWSPRMIESAILPYRDINQHRGTIGCSFLARAEGQSSKALLLLRVSSFFLHLFFFTTTHYTIIFLCFLTLFCLFLLFSPLILQWANTSPVAGNGSDVCSKFGCATKHRQRAIQFRVDVEKKSKEDIPYNNN